MKSLKLFTTTFLSLILLASCAGNSAAIQGNDSSSTDVSNPGNPANEASFSCKIDGKDFSTVGSTGNLNAAFHLKDDKKGQIFFMLADINDPAQKLNFQISGKTGSVIIKNDPPHYSYEGLVLKNFATYTDDPVSVNIISVSSTRVSGTFSGTYTLQKGTGDNTAKQTILITDGKFDIPFSTSEDWKKLYNAE